MKRILSLLSLLAFFAGTVNAQTAGTATFQVTTVSNGGQYSPANVLAIWVKNSSGTFVKSMKVMAAQRIQYLYQWKASSSLNTVGAITGATLSSHQTHTIAWNCKNASNVLVADGDYQFWVEFADDDFQGPCTHYTFTKGPSAQTQNFTDATRFINVSIVWTPDPNGVEETVQPAKIIRNPGSDLIGFVLPTQIADNAQLQIFDITGNRIFSTANYFDDGNSRYFVWNSLGAKQGLYIYRIESGATISSGKIFR